jgi:hypothetical protein
MEMHNAEVKLHYRARANLIFIACSEKEVGLNAFGTEL